MKRTVPPVSCRQRGAALFIALIALVAMTFAGLALIRAMDTAGLIAGNFSFRQAALSVADLGLEGALGALESAYIPNGRDNNQSCAANQTTGCATACTQNCTYYAWYYDAAHCSNSATPPNCDNPNGVSQRIDWSNIPSNNISFAALGSGFQYQYVIERLCDATLPAGGTTVVGTANVAQYCFSMNLATGGNSKAGGHGGGGSNYGSSNEMAYRTTIRVLGPHNASTLVQAILMKKND